MAKITTNVPPSIYPECSGYQVVLKLLDLGHRQLYYADEIAGNWHEYIKYTNVIQNPCMHKMGKCLSLNSKPNNDFHLYIL